MKTLFGLVRALKGRAKKKELRQPKKIWRVDIDIGEILWTAFVSECPCYKHLHEMWELESRISGSWLAAHDGPAADKVTVDAWKQQNETAKRLIRLMFAYRFSRNAIVDDSAITITEEVLH